MNCFITFVRLVQPILISPFLSQSSCISTRKRNSVKAILEASYCNSRTGNEEREIRAGSKISRPELKKAGNGKKIKFTPLNYHI